MKEQIGNNKAQEGNKAGTLCAAQTTDHPYEPHPFHLPVYLNTQFVSHTGQENKASRLTSGITLLFGGKIGSSKQMSIF